MFDFFKKEMPLPKIDIHSHLIPSIDDGAQDMEQSLFLIRELQRLGYEKLVITPHISDIFPNTHKIIIDGYEQLKNEIENQKIDIQLEVAAEYYIDDRFFELLEGGEMLSFSKENYLLFEFSYFTPPSDIDNLIYEIQKGGYQPVLAHPERYCYWHEDLRQYELLKEMGILFQINLNSIVGYYPTGVKRTVEQLIINGMVDFLGSDTHHQKHLNRLKEVSKNTLYKKVFKYNIILNNRLSF